jgi:hypothetical protein
MTRQKTFGIALLALAVSGVWTLAEARGKSGPFEVALHFIPQEGVDEDAPALTPEMRERPVRLVMEDGRGNEDPAVIGESSDDDDKLWPVRSTGDVAAWANEVLQKTAAGWGVKTSDSAPLVLTGRLTHFVLTEGNKAVGSVYNGDVKVAFALKDSRGKLLWEGAAGGDATRYGKARNAENANEVLNDATKEAYADLFANPGLQDAWGGKATAGAPAAARSTNPAVAPAAPSVRPADLLAELVKLKKQGFDTGLLVDYVNKKTVSPSLSADDMVKWKQAGMPPEVIKAALERAGS